MKKDDAEAAAQKEAALKVLGLSANTAFVAAHTQFLSLKRLNARNPNKARELDAAWSAVQDIFPQAPSVDMEAMDYLVSSEEERRERQPVPRSAPTLAKPGL